MKYTSTFLFVALIGFFCLPGEAVAQGLPYNEGTVWGVSFVKTKPGMGNDYLRNLAEGWKKVNDEAKKQGLVISYKILSGSAASRDDWDLMLMVEYKNMAAMDGIDQKFQDIAGKVMGSEDQQRDRTVKRGELREILGNKLLRELILK